MTSLTGFTNAVVSVGGGAVTLTAINNSSVDRQQNEKVWIRQIVDGWEIIDYASADVNSLTAKCDETIAIGATGSVSLADDGVLVQRFVRDFSLGSGVLEEDIDDSAKIFHFGNYPHSGSSNYIYRYITSRALNITTATYRNNMLLKLCYKITKASSSTTSFPSYQPLAQLTKVNSDSWQSGIQNLPEFEQQAASFVERTVYSGTSSDKLTIPNGVIIDFDKWIDVEYKLTSNPVKNKLTISDRLGNSQSASDGIATALGTPLQRFNIGSEFRSSSSDPLINIDFDLARTGLYTADGQTVLWEPYKPMII